MPCWAISPPSWPTGARAPTKAGPARWFRWPDPEADAGAWQAAADALEGELDASFGTKRGLAVVVVENFDILMATVFKEDVAQQRLRAG